MNADANYINQFNQQATESIKNSIGVSINITRMLYAYVRVCVFSSQNVNIFVSLPQLGMLHVEKCRRSKERLIVLNIEIVFLWQFP